MPMTYFFVFSACDNLYLLFTPYMFVRRMCTIVVRYMYYVLAQVLVMRGYDRLMLVRSVCACFVQEFAVSTCFVL